MTDLQEFRLQIRVLLASDAGVAADATAIADAAATLGERLRRQLAPLVGEGGVLALYARSLHLTKAEFPWLALTRHTEPADTPFTQLRASLGRQDATVALEAASAFIATFCGLLTSLIGDAMTNRLLHEAWPDGFFDSTAGDPP